MSEGVLDGRAEQQLDDVLARRALEVLDANWLGHGTRPSRLYPHQWSWDSACIAIGVRTLEPGSRRDASFARCSRASGRTASSRTSSSPTGSGRYFPGPEFWQSERSRRRPAASTTSGIVQPPLHATAALRVYRQSADRDAGERVPATSCCRSSRAWHEYLYRERTRGDDGLVEIWHPVGVGHGQLAALGRGAGTDRPAAGARSPTTSGSTSSSPILPSGRPTPSTTATSYLVGLFRELGYDADPDPRRDARSRYSRSSSTRCSCRRTATSRRSRACSATIPEPFEAWAEQTAAGIDTKLWNEADGAVRRLRRPRGEHVAARTAAGLAPLYAGVPPGSGRAQMVERLAASRVAVGGRAGR